MSSGTPACTASGRHLSSVTVNSACSASAMRFTRGVDDARWKRHSHGASDRPWRQRMVSGPEESSSHPGTCRHRPGRPSGTHDARLKQPALPNEQYSPGGRGSTSVTAWPRICSCVAHASPTTPAPMTVTRETISDSRPPAARTARRSGRCCREQLLVRADRLDRAVGEHDDAVGHAHAREAVRDQHRGLAARQLLEALEHLELGARVERRRRLVEDQHLRVAHVGARDRDLLPFAAGQVDAGAEALADHLVVAVAAAWRSPRRRGCAARPSTMRARSSRASMRPTAMLSAAVR